MKIEILKSSGKCKCRGTRCKGNPEYIKKHSNYNWTIISGTTCACITIVCPTGHQSAYYCRDCMDDLFVDFKIALDPKLWVFK